MKSTLSSNFSLLDSISIPKMNMEILHSIMLLQMAICKRVSGLMKVREIVDFLIENGIRCVKNDSGNTPLRI